MARRSRQVLLIAAAGACLTLCACGASAAPRAAGSGGAGSPSARTGSAALTAHFCSDASTFMRDIPAESATKRTSRAELGKSLRSTVKGFTALEAEAPARLRKPLKVIVRVYKSDEKIVRTSASPARISQSMVRGNDAGSVAFERLLKYISVSCK